VVESLGAGISALTVLKQFSAVGLPLPLALCSGGNQSGIQGRYSFVTADPFATKVLQVGCPEPFTKLASFLQPNYQTPTLPGLPPFQGGLAGVLHYDLNRSLEHIPPPQFDEFQLPAATVGLYDVVLAVDHFTDEAWLISQGLPELDPASRHRRAVRRLRDFKGIIDATSADNSAASLSGYEKRTDLAPQFSTHSHPSLTSSFSAEGYLAAVQKAIDYIWAGDVFQVNLSQRLMVPQSDHPLDLFERFQQLNAAPFSGYFDCGKYQIVSASPERFFNVHNGIVETRPIKGTRPRAPGQADIFAARELSESEKDRSENVMIVDLLRNDLSPVCDSDSVVVTQLCEIETFAFVHHLVSAIQGKLSAGQTPLDLLNCTFPGGSITGAPKVRAMEIIAELEPTARGAYCGCLGYVGFDGSSDWSILIRTVTAAGGWWQLPVGGGIVADSVPQKEWEETWHKAEGILRALR
jgi:para-aminobenzoate synthetase component 1